MNTKHAKYFIHSPWTNSEKSAGNWIRPPDTLLLVSATIDTSPENHAKRNIAKIRDLSTDMFTEAQALSSEMENGKNVLAPLDQYLEKTATN